MPVPDHSSLTKLSCLVALFLGSVAASATGSLCTGTLRDSSGNVVANAKIQLRSSNGDFIREATTSANGTFGIDGAPEGSYRVSVALGQNTWQSSPIHVHENSSLTVNLQIPSSGEDLRVQVGLESKAPSPPGEDDPSPQASGGQRLSSGSVSSLPLNARDFSKLLLLASGTMTDANGAANFTQQFAVNGQRGVTTVFAMDGFDTTDPEMGGATFSNFNVDAIQEVQSNSGVMPAEIGHGAASFTNVVTKSGTNQVHGSVFEFLRNAA